MYDVFPITSGHWVLFSVIGWLVCVHNYTKTTWWILMRLDGQWGTGQGRTHQMCCRAEQKGRARPRQGFFSLLLVFSRYTEICICYYYCRQQAICACVAATNQHNNWQIKLKHADVWLFSVLTLLSFVLCTLSSPILLSAQKTLVCLGKWTSHIPVKIQIELVQDRRALQRGKPELQMSVCFQYWLPLIILSCQYHNRKQWSH